MTDQAKPGYLEAYPCLNSLRCTAKDPLISETEARSRERPLKKRKSRQKPDLCRYINEAGLCLGDVVILGQTDKVLWISYSIHGPYFTGDESYARLNLERATSGTHIDRSYFICDGCHRRLINLVWDGCWLCRKCLGFVHRVQLLPPDVARFETMISLREQIGRARPHRMRNSTFSRLKQQLDELEQEFEGRWLSASQEHSRLVTATWCVRSEFSGEVFAKV